MKFRYTDAFVLLLVFSASVIFAGVRQYDYPGNLLAVPVAYGELPLIRGGCNVSDNKNCTATSALNCGGNCAGKAAGDACSGRSTVQNNPTYKGVKDGANGKKGKKPLNSSVLCYELYLCGSNCANTQQGLICPFSTLPVYEAEEGPDGDDCDPVQGMNSPSLERSHMKTLFASNGGLVMPFNY